MMKLITSLKVQKLQEMNGAKSYEIKERKL